MKQLAFRLCTFFDVLLLLLSWGTFTVFQWSLSELPLSPSPSCRTTTNLLFYRCSSCFQCNMSKRQQACPFPAGVVFFSFWWGQTYCAPNSLELEQLFMPTWLDLTMVPVGSNARLLKTELNPILIVVVFSSVHQLVPHSVPYFMRSSLPR